MSSVSGQVKITSLIFEEKVMNKTKYYTILFFFIFIATEHAFQFKSQRPKFYILQIIKNLSHFWLKK